MAKVTIEIPDGAYCTGCPCSIITIGPNRWDYGCRLLRIQCDYEGEFQQRAVKRPDCPASDK